MSTRGASPAESGNLPRTAPAGATDMQPSTPASPRAAWWILGDGTPAMLRGVSLVIALVAFGWNPGTVAAWGAIALTVGAAARLERAVKSDPGYRRIA